MTGSVTLRGDTVTAADATVQMADVTSDRSQRDQQFAGRIMDTAQYPTGTFTLTAPVHLAALPAVGPRSPRPPRATSRCTGPPVR